MNPAYTPYGMEHKSFEQNVVQGLPYFAAGTLAYVILEHYGTPEMEVFMKYAKDRVSTVPINSAMYDYLTAITLQTNTVGSLLDEIHANNILNATRLVMKLKEERPADCKYILYMMRQITISLYGYCELTKMIDESCPILM